MGKKKTVLIIDDNELNRTVLCEILHREYFVLEASNGKEGLKILNELQQMPNAILLDVIMPDMDGFAVLGHLKNQSSTENIPVLLITALNTPMYETKGLQMGAVDYILKPFNPEVVKTRLKNHMELNEYKNSLKEMVEHKILQLRQSEKIILDTLATIIEYRSLESSSHIRRTVEFVSALTKHLLTKEKFSEQLKNCNYPVMIRASSLHDIGKIGIPDSLLLKKGPLTSKEFDIVKQHTIIGEEIMNSLVHSIDPLYLKHCRDICRNHHEKWDGTGYPDGLSEENIPLSARILAIVDVYDALTSKRCYKSAYSHEQTLEKMQEGKHTHFDPDILDAMLEIHHVFKHLTLTIC